MTGTAAVGDDHVTVSREVSGPVVVSFDGQYVWSFVPARDGVHHGTRWQVAWPDALRRRLSGTSHVRLSDTAGTRIHFEDDVAFGGRSEPLALHDSHGYPLAVDKEGHLIRVFSETGDDVRRQIAEGTARAIDDLRTRIGIDAHVSYGCLLGAVRDGKMIPHDSDSDLAYLSEQTSPADLIRESYRIERELRSLGWRVQRMSGGDLKLFLPLSDGRDVHLDIFAAFHVGEVFYQLGGRSGRLPREAMTPASTVVLEGVKLAAPADPEAVLAFLYGPDWRNPDPAYQAVEPAEGVRRLNGWLRGFRARVADWNELLIERREELPRNRSTFAQWVHDQLPPGAPIADLGSGSGRDSSWFTFQGHPVCSFDYASAALRQTSRRLTRHIEDPDVRSLTVNDSRSALLAGAELSRTPEPHHLYARQLAGCLDGEGRANLWRLSSMALRRGGSLFLEFGAGIEELRDPDLLIRRLDPEAVAAQIREYGGRVVSLTTGPGVDFFDQPDPLITRLVARWAADDHDHPEEQT
ncbi:MAG: mucin-5AC [Marmoricola sp.]|nr:mucin-5AC [Marmoricola sp.]